MMIVVCCGALFGSCILLLVVWSLAAVELSYLLLCGVLPVTFEAHFRPCLKTLRPCFQDKGLY